MKAKLCKSGLSKILPVLEELAEEIYGDHGGLWIRIGYDGELRMETKNPFPFIEEARKSGITISYVGKDKFGESCFDVYVPISEQGGVAAPGPGQAVTTPVTKPISHSPTSVSPQKGVGTTAQEKATSMPDQETMVKTAVARATPEIKKIMKGLMDKFSDSLK